MSKLNREDSVALDLLMDAANAAHAPGEGPLPQAEATGGPGPASVGSFVAVSQETVMPDSIRKVARVLGLLAQMPVEEPSSDLIQRTLARIGRSTGDSAAHELGPRGARHPMKRPNVPGGPRHSQPHA